MFMIVLSPVAKVCLLHGLIVFVSPSSLWLAVCSQFMVGVGAGTAIVCTYPDVLTAVM